MKMLKKPLLFETAFGTYTARELLGEGGAGVVYGGVGPDEKSVAIKLLSSDRVTSDKRRRFKNEIAFLARTKHPNIVSLIDHGVDPNNGASRPFYIMPRYSGSLRVCLEKALAEDVVMRLFGQLMDGVEAAHLHGIVHRDLKPENVLHDNATNTVAVADFGVAQFTEDFLITLVETQAQQRLANFQYAAPEQRTRGAGVSIPADIYALGLMLNELFTGVVPHGTEYKQIGQVSPRFAFLDPIVAKMIRQAPADRPGDISTIKGLIQQHQAEAVTLQKLSELSKTVVPEGSVDDPLAFDPPRLIGAEWNDGKLTLTLDRSVSENWVQSFQNIGNYTSVMGAEPRRFTFSGKRASVAAPDNSAQDIVTYFKQWLPQATQVLKEALHRRAIQEQATRLEQIRREKEAVERRLRVNRSLKI